MTKVYRDINGKIINIGDWDLMEEQVPTNYPPKDINEKDLNSWDYKFIKTIRNPIPENATFKDEEIETMEDGSRVALGDYSTKRRLSYPSIVDQLDDIYHNGIDAWRANIKSIKDNNPK